MDELTEKNLKTFVGKNSRLLLRSISLTPAKSIASSELLRKKGRPWQELLNIQAEGCVALTGSCLEVLRPNKPNFTTALT